MKKPHQTNSFLKLFIISFLFLGFVSTANSQDFQERFTKTWTLSSESKFDQALPQFFDLLKEQPYNEQVHVQIGWIYLCQKNMPKALEYLNNAYDLKMDDIAVVLTKSYYEFATGNKEKGTYYLDMGMWLDFNGQNKSAIITDYTNLKTKYNLNPVMMDFAINRVNSNYDSRNKSYISIFNLLGEAYQQLSTKEYVKAQQTYKKAIAQYTNAPVAYQFIKAATAMNIAETFKYYYLPDDLEYANMALEVAKSHPNSVSPMLVTSAAYIVSNYYYIRNDHEKALVACQAYENNIDKTIDYGYAKARFMVEYLSVLTVTNASTPTTSTKAKITSLANKLYTLKNTGNDVFYQAKAHNFLGMLYIKSVIPSDRAQGAKYLKSAYDIADKNGITDLASSISGNLGFSYWQMGEKQKAKDIYVKRIEDAVAAKDYNKAQNETNTLGSFYYMDKNYAEAINYYEKSVYFLEKTREKLDDENKLLYLQTVGGTYKFLASSYAKVGNGVKLFEHQNKDRARILSETINQKQSLSNVSLQEFQNLLKNDEVALFYSLMDAGTFIINVVTKENVWPMQIEEHSLWANIKKMYLNRMHAASNKKSDYMPATGYIEKDGIKYRVTDNMQISTPDMIEIMELTRECLQDIEGQIPVEVKNTLLAAYYQSLISPVLNKISNKKKLIIFSDGYLNFLPFEALIMPNKSYLIQNFDVRYCQSADIFKLVNSRNYSPQRKDFLGMGGAQYQDMAEQVEPPRTPEELLKLQVKAKENASNNKSQRLVYASLYGSKKMNYLPGTLQEVQNLSKIFTSKDVFLGTEMTENLIKRMSVTNQLKNYKILHLATHGFAVEQIPELSGIAMCITSQMQGGEDGYLNAPEISKLNINADLAVLSACDTGLGKIYGGEGVSGLTGSLLVAGANQALVSLWPVSDMGTMHFMTGMYQLVTGGGKNYDEAVSVMKRRFIKGDFGPQFTHFNFWAPYITYGK